MQQTISYLEQQVKTYQSKDTTGLKFDTSKIKDTLSLEE